MKGDCQGRGSERNRETKWPPRYAEMRGGPAPLAYLFSGIQSLVRPSRFCPAASERPLLWLRDSCRRTGTRRGGAGQEARSRPPIAPPFSAAPPRPRPPEKGRSGADGGGGERGLRLSQWQCGRCTKSPMGEGCRAGGVGPGAGPGGLGDSSGITKGAGCQRRGQPRASPRKERKET